MIFLKIPNKTHSANRRLLRRSGGVLLAAILLLCVWLMGGATAYGWLLHADHYGDAFAAYGTWYFVCAGGMTLAVLLYFCKKDLSAAILGTVSYLPMLCILLNAIRTAEEKGWSGQTEASFGQTAGAVWRNGQMWNGGVLLLLLLLTLTRFFSDDAAAARKIKRDAKAKQENLPAPSILADSPQKTSEPPSVRHKP